MHFLVLVLFVQLERTAFRTASGASSWGAKGLFRGRWHGVGGAGELLAEPGSLRWTMPKPRGSATSRQCCGTAGQGRGRADAGLVAAGSRGPPVDGLRNGGWPRAGIGIGAGRG